MQNSLFIEVHLFLAFLKARKISREGHFTFWFLAFDFIIIALLPYLNLLGGDMQTKYTIFLLELVSSMQIDSILRLLRWGNLLVTMPSRTKTIFPLSFESQSFLNKRNWYPSILNWLSGRLVSSLTSSVQSMSILDVEMISLTPRTLYKKD